VLRSAKGLGFVFWGEGEGEGEGEVLMFHEFFYFERWAKLHTGGFCAASFRYLACAVGFYGLLEKAI
jgi:hypothetical protein